MRRTKKEEIIYTIKFDEMNLARSKGTILSEVEKILDLSGLLDPIISYVKTAMQDTWKERYDWDKFQVLFNK